jgi:hypothetical protein
VSAFPARRGFLKAALTLLTGAAAPTASAPPAWAEQPNFEGVPGVDVTPNNAHELLVRLPDVDGFRLRKATAEEVPSPGGLALSLFRYEPQLSRTVHRLVLPWMDVRAGLYLRSTVPYRTRVVLDPDDGELTTSFVTSRRTSVAVYRETPLGIDGPPWQVMVLIGGEPPAWRILDPDWDKMRTRRGLPAAGLAV